MTAPPSITCPRCGATSYNINDIRERYCGSCHKYHLRAGDMEQWTIYDHPADFPNNFVARQRFIGASGSHDGDYVIYPHLDGLRAYIQSVLPGAVCLTRSPEDAPVIVETWL